MLWLNLFSLNFYPFIVCIVELEFWKNLRVWHHEYHAVIYIWSNETPTFGNDFVGNDYHITLQFSLCIPSKVHSHKVSERLYDSDYQDIFFRGNGGGMELQNSSWKWGEAIVPKSLMSFSFISLIRFPAPFPPEKKPCWLPFLLVSKCSRGLCQYYSVKCLLRDCR